LKQLEIFTPAPGRFNTQTEWQNRRKFGRFYVFFDVVFLKDVYHNCAAKAAKFLRQFF